MLDRRRFAVAAAVSIAGLSRHARAAVDPVALGSAVALGSRAGGSGAIHHDGNRIAAWGDQRRKYSLKSSTKSFGSLLLGLAVQDGRVELDGAARPLLPDFGTPPSANADGARLDAVRLRHLATHTAGFGKKGGFVPLLFEPATAWSYSDGGANWLADVLTVRFGQDLAAVLRGRILQPIGAASGVTWRTNRYRPTLVNGITRREFGSGINASVDALAKVGLMLLAGGRGLLDASYIGAAATPQEVAAPVPQAGTTVHPGANRHYGLLFWNNGDGAMAGVPSDAYWSWGLGDSFVLIVPSKRLVVARAGPAWQSGWGDLATIQPFFAAACAAVT